MIRSHTSIITLSFILITQLHAAEMLVVTLRNVGDRVRSQNLDLRAARLVVDEALGMEKQAGRLENPELQVSMQHNDRFTEKGLMVGFDQKFPVTDRLRLEKQHSATAVDAARREIAVIENRLVGEARELLVEVLALRGRIDLLRQQGKVVHQLADYTREAAERGEASMLDAGQVKLEHSRIEAERLRLEVEVKRKQGALKPLLGMRGHESLEVPGELPGLDPVPPMPAGDSPAVRLARLEVRQAEQLAAIEKSRRYDDIKAGIFAGLERVVDDPGAPEREAVIGLRVTMPLPLWNRNEGRIDAARAAAERKCAELKALEQRVGLESGSLSDEIDEWAALAREIESKLLPVASEQTALAEEAWRKGQIGLLGVMKSREQEIQLATARLDALKNFHLARVRQQSVLGLH